MTSHIRALGYLYLVLNGVSLLVGAALCISLIPPERDAWKASTALQFVGPLFLMLAAVYFIPGFLGGWGLLKGRSWGRMIVIVLSILFLPLFPIGTVLGGYGLWVLFQPAARLHFSRQEGALIAHPLVPSSGHAERPSSRLNGLLLAMAAVASGFIVLIGTGYRLSGDPNSPIGSSAFYGAIAVLAGAIVITAREIKAGRWPRRSVRATTGPARGDTRQLVYYRLPDDPAVQYSQDVTMLATCPHLMPIEQVMRNEGILMGLIKPLQVRAYCVIDPAELHRRFSPAASVSYSEPPAYGAGAGDPPAAVITCEACHSGIETVHQLSAVGETPGFPAGKARLDGEGKHGS